MTSGSEIELGFNNVSKPLMEDASDFIRSRCVSPTQMLRQPTTVPDAAITDHFFRAVFLMGRGLTPISAFHFEPPSNRCLDRNGWRRMTTGLLLLLPTDELIRMEIVSRRPSLLALQTPGGP